MGRTDETMCPTCHKPIIFGAKASITSWIFRDYRCRCRNPQPITAVPRRQPEQAEVGQAIPGYQIIECIGFGGMGVLYKAHKHGIEGTFAIKVLRRELIKDQGSLVRFEQEADLAKQLTHANLVSVYERGISKLDAPYLVMDFVDGESLDKRLGRETSLDARQAINMFVQICDAMEYAHSFGVLHRDLKPSNVLISQSRAGIEVVKVVDFGIAKLLPRVSRETLNLTKTGELFGSPFYMSPEQCMGEELDERSDIYSMGCVMYEVLTGSPPFKSDNPVKTIMQHLTSVPRSCGSIAVGHTVGSDLEEVVMQCLAKDRANRVESMSALRQRLEVVASRLGAGKDRMHASVSYVYRRRAIVFWSFSAVMTYGVVAALIGNIQTLALVGLYFWIPIWYFRKMIGLKTTDKILKTQEPEQIELELFMLVGSFCARFAMPGKRSRARVLSVSFRGGKMPTEIKSFFNGERRTVMAYRDKTSGEPVAIILGRYLCVVTAEVLPLPLKQVEQLPLLPPLSDE